MDIAQLFRYLFTFPYYLSPLPPVTLLLNTSNLLRHRVGLSGSAIEIDSKKGSASQKGWEPLPYCMGRKTAFFQRAFEFTYNTRNRSPLRIKKKIITINLKKTE